MLVTLKTLQQQIFKVEVDPEDTILQLKQKIFEVKGEGYAVDIQKLIYAGKILENTQKINFYKIEEKSFVVVMVTLPKATPLASATTTTTTTTTATTVPVQPPLIPTQPQVDNPAALTGISVTPEMAESALVTGETFEKAVREIVNMGFDRELVLQAMAASYNNPDRAVEYLLSGTLPEEGLGRPPSQAANPSSAAPPAASISPGADDPLAFMMAQPQFQQMRSLIQSNPELLPTIMQQISQSNPRLMQMITENQDRFVQMLNDPNLTSGSAIGNQPAAPFEPGTVPGEQQGESSYIQVTPDERQAIERLKQLGFPESMCLQAYFACEKNEDLAANFLLSQDFDDFYEHN